MIYAGTGETTIRIDVSLRRRRLPLVGRWHGRGSTLGLTDTHHIGRICVHPRDPDLVYVAALGDAFGPHEERGVFRSRDGGRHWEQVLFRGPDAGAVDLSMDPNNPRILFAGSGRRGAASGT